MLLHNEIYPFLFLIYPHQLGFGMKIQSRKRFKSAERLSCTVVLAIGICQSNMLSVQTNPASVFQVKLYLLVEGNRISKGFRSVGSVCSGIGIHLTVKINRE